MGLAHIDSGLDDDQVQSLVHQLRHEYGQDHPGAGGDAPSAAAAWDGLRARLADRIIAHPDLRQQRRAGLLRRVEHAQAPPPPDMVYAAEHIRDRAVRVARLLSDHLAVEAARVGIPDVDAGSIYHDGRGAAPGGRQQRATTQERRRWNALPLDPRTRHGLAALADRPDNPDGRSDLIGEHAPVSSATSAGDVAAVGYHADSQRLEVLTPQGDVLAYRDVSPELARRLSGAAVPDDVFRHALLGNRAHQYRDAVQASAAGVRRRCPHCGQFTGATHNCLGNRGGGVDEPAVPVAAVHMQSIALPAAGPAGSDLSIQGYPLLHVAAAADSRRGEWVEFPVSVDDGTEPSQYGAVLVSVGTDDQVSVGDSRLMCTCPDWASPGGCSHTRRVAAGVRAGLAGQLEAARTQTAAAAVSATTRPADEQILPSAPNLSTFSYTADPARFAADVRATLDRTMTGDAVPYLEPDGMYGFGAAREFGVELEFDVQSDPPPFGELPIDAGLSTDYQRTHYRGTLPVYRVGRALFEAGLTPHERQTRYHSAGTTGYQRTVRGGYTFEADCSVSGGEVVTPILSDTPETWATLRQACTLITANGGRASAGTGSHVSVSAADQAGQRRRVTRFLRLLHHHQPDLHVMAAAGHDRGSHYAQPMAEPPQQGYQRMNDISRLGRYGFVNMTHVAASGTHWQAPSSRIEFRLWDGSLDPGRIQAQIKVSAALLDYSTHNRELTFGAADRSAEAAIDPDAPEFAAQTGQVRHLIDSLFRRDVDKQQAAALWGAGLAVRGMRRSVPH